MDPSRYDVNVQQSGSYIIDIRVAREPSGNQSLHIEVDGANVTGVNITLDEVDVKTQSVKMIIEGRSLNYPFPICHRMQLFLPAGSLPRSVRYPDILSNSTQEF